MLQRRPFPSRARQRGVAAIMVALSLAMLIGCAGVVLDLGRLFVNKTELQNAADACALAAASELVCDPSLGTCPAAYLENAEAAGIYVAGRNKGNLQASAVVIAAADITFHTAIGPNSAYLSRAAGASVNARYVMCTAKSGALATWFMKAAGNITSMSVNASAVGTLAPGQTACNAAPVGICAQNTTPPNYGYNTVGAWIVSQFNSGGGDDSTLTGNFRWVDFGGVGGVNVLRDQLLGNSAVCGIKVGDDVSEQGVKQGTKSAWNTRFGIYPNGANAATPSTVAPDKTGFAYPSKNPGAIDVGVSAYTDYRAKQASNTPFSNTSYAGSNANGNTTSAADHLAYGSERRLIAVPILECGKSSAKILAMGCVLMLNPMPNGNSGDLYLEWRGRADSPGSPCRSAGVAGGTNGPLVPTLVQ